MAQSIEVLGAYGLSYGPSFVENAAAAARHTNLGNGEVCMRLLFFLLHREPVII